MARPFNTPEQAVAAKVRRKAWEKTWVKEYRTNNPQKHLLFIARARAKRRGMECTITAEDIVLPEFCPYLGIKLQPTCRRGEKRGNIYTLDRKDNTKGYVPGNVEVISWQANTMKTNATQEELLAFAKAVIDRERLGGRYGKFDI